MEITPIIKTDFLTFSDDDTLSEMFGQLKEKEERTGLVFRKDKYIGLVEKKRLMRSRIDLTTAKVSTFVKNTPILSEHADIIESAYLMHQSNMDYLPVERNKKIFGVLRAIDLAKLALELPELKGLKVTDIKMVKPQKLNKDDPVSAALDIIYQERIEQVPIFEKGQLYGIISYRDLMRKYINWAPKREFSAKFSKMASSRGAETDMPKLTMLPVSSFSSNENLLTVSISSSLSEAVRQMAGKSFNDAIVTGTDGYLGLLTVKSILRRVGSLKIPQNFNIKFVGLNDLGLQEYHKFNLKKIAANESFKLQRLIRNEFTLVIHIKAYGKEGKRKKYSVTMRIELPSRLITSSQADWDFETALRKTFDNAKNKLKQKFRGDSSWAKYYE